MSKIPQPKRSKNLKHINNQRNDEVTNNISDDIVFSLKYLLEDNDFHIDHNDAKYLRQAIRRLRDLCKMPKISLLINRSGALKAHRVDWDDPRVSRESFGIPNETDLCAEAYQFSISANEDGRIIGFFTGDCTFNIVWFDKNHKLYPGKLS